MGQYVVQGVTQWLDFINGEWFSVVVAVCVVSYVLLVSWCSREMILTPLLSRPRGNRPRRKINWTLRRDLAFLSALTVLLVMFAFILDEKVHAAPYVARITAD